MPPPFPRLLPVLALLGPLALASPALAQDIASAEVFFNRGIADLEAGRFEAACTAIGESQRLDPRPGTLFSLAVCEARWGHIASAATRFGDYLALYERLTPSQQVRQGERPKVAKAERIRLTADIPELTISLLPGAPAGTVVKRDGVVISAAGLGMGLPVEPGEHTLSTQAPGGPVLEQRVTIARREKKQMTLEVKAAPSVEPPPRKPVPAVVSPVVLSPSTGKAPSSGPLPAPVSPKKGGISAWTWAAGGVGLAALGAGVAFAVDHASARRTMAADCPGDVCDSTRYSLETMQSLRGRWNRDLGLAVGLGAVGLVGVSVAAVGIARRPQENRQPTSPTAALTPWLSPNAGGAFISGAF